MSLSEDTCPVPVRKDVHKDILKYVGDLKHEYIMEKRAEQRGKVSGVVGKIYN